MPVASSGSTTTDLDPRKLHTRPPTTVAETAVQSAGADERPWTFGRYRVERRLGQGGMGDVFLAQDTQLQRTVALKIPRLAADRPALRARFLREARAAASLAHPNICPVYDADEIDGQPYLTMAYIDGPPLAGRLGQVGPFTAAQAVALVRTVARAMQHAHERGILHRDLKPANMLLNSSDEPIVTDFGLAFRLDTDRSERLTEQGLLVGTPAYMPPEQINAQELGPTADVYSLGMVLYELLTGKVAFEAPLGKLLAQIESAAPLPPSRLRPGLSPMLDGICLKALAKRPQDRFATMAEFATALEDYGAGRERLELSTATLVFLRPRPQRRWISIVAAGLCTVAGSLVLAWLLWPEHVADRDTSADAAERDPKAADIKLLFAQMKPPLLRIEAVATDKVPLRLARAMIPEKLLLQPAVGGPQPAPTKGEGKSRFKHHAGPLCFAVSGSGKGHVVDLTDQVGQEMQLTGFGAGDMTMWGPNISFLNQLGDAAQVFLKGGPGYSILAALQDGNGSKHVEFDGTHLLLSKIETPTIDDANAATSERATLRNPQLTRKITLRYRACDYVIYTKPDVIVIPGDHEQRRVEFPEMYNLIELDRERQFKARIITAQRLQRAIDDGKKK
jgi:hypothetical protein